MTYLGVLKTLKYVKLSVKPEGSVQPSLKVVYDYDDSTIPQPAAYTLSSIPTPAIFGTGAFNAVTFGAAPNPMTRQTVEGSGNTALFKIFSNDQNGPYTINGIYIDYVPSGRN